MKELMDELLGILSMEAEIYVYLLSLSKEKTNVIVTGKVNALDKIVRTEQELILKLGALEEKREGIAERIGTWLGMKSSDITMSELISKLEPVQAKDLKSHQNKLSGIIGEITDLNTLNSKLVKNSLEYINFSMNLMSETNNTGNNYGNNAKVSDWAKRNLFDMKL